MIVMRSKRHEKGSVYVIAAANDHVKIGSTGGDPFERFNTVACHSPLPVTLAYICTCAFPVDVEEAVHRLLDAHRSHREWFDLPVTKAIETIRAVLAARGYMPVQIVGRRAAAVGRRAIHYAGITEAAL